MTASDTWTAKDYIRHCGGRISRRPPATFVDFGDCVWAYGGCRRTDSL